MKIKNLVLSITAIFMIVLACNTGVNAQKKFVNKAQSWASENTKLDTALGAIRAAESHEKTQDWYKTYYVKGLVYQAIAKSENPQFKSLSEYPLFDAFDNIKKAYEMEGSKIIHSAADLILLNMANDIINKGVEAYQADDMVNAFKYFEKSLEVKQMPVFNGEIDTAIVFNCALVAHRNQDYDNAIKYYNQSIELNYGEGDTYSYLATCYKEKNEIENYVNTLKKGFEKYPSNKSLLGGIINYYILDSENTEEALKYLAVARESDPTNPQFYSAEAHLYDKLGNKEMAIEKYKKAIEIKEDFFEAYYNLGVLYFNDGITLTDEANKITDNAKFAVAKEKADNKFKESVPYLEKAHELEPSDASIMSTLKTLYYRLQMTDKYNEVSKKME